MNTNAPRVSIGMPVYNGELYLGEAVNSIVAQTYKDFELIISDNASTDGTPDICRAFADKDRRIRYYRNEKNLGLSRNLNRVIELSTAEFFMIAHHDDVRAPECVERCVKVLDSDPSVVLCYSKTRDIDEKGRFLERTDPRLSVDADRPRDRFRDLIRMDHICEPDFGLTRTRVLKQTRLHGNYPDSDRVLLAELGLYGRFYQIPEYLFFRRAHPLQSTALYPGRLERTRLFDPAKAGRIVFPHFRQFVEYLLVISRVPMARHERLLCYVEMVKWLSVNQRRLRKDLTIAIKQMLRPLKMALTSHG